MPFTVMVFSPMAVTLTHDHIVVTLVLQLNVNDLSLVLHSDVVDIALLELVLDLELAAVSGNGVSLDVAIDEETVLERFLLILGYSTIILNCPDRRLPWSAGGL